LTLLVNILFLVELRRESTARFSATQLPFPGRVERRHRPS